MTNILSNELRRSARLSTYDSNGRDYLANTIGWTRTQLETWLRAPTVRPHLRDWLRLCIEDSRRFNDAVDWINTGDNGYYYHLDDLEENLLHKCMYEGVGEDGKILSDNRKESYAAQDIKTGHWLTEELWARAAWRIAQADQHGNSDFDLERHSAKAYAFVADVLCIAFHSIAHRGKGSVYYGLIVGFTHAAQIKWAKERAVWLKVHGDEDACFDAESETGTGDPSAKNGAMAVDVEVAVNADPVPQEPSRNEAVEKWIDEDGAFTDDDFEEGTETESVASEFAG